MNKTTTILVLAAMFLAAASFGTAFAAQDSVPVEVTADAMEYSQSGNLVTFKGDVHVSRPDFQLWAATIEVYLAEGVAADANATATPDLDPGQVSKIVASGGVRMQSGDKTGTCGSAVYLVKEGYLQMNGNPVLKDGQNTIKGKTIKFYVHSNRSEVVGDKDHRVTATFSSPDELKKDK